MGINLFYNQRKVRRVVIGAQTANLYMYIRTENVNYRVATLLTFLYMRRRRREIRLSTLHNLFRCQDFKRHEVLDTTFHLAYLEEFCTVQLLKCN